MPRVIVDTNVLVSSLIQRSYPYFIMHEIFSRGGFQLCLSEALLQEYYAVLTRPKFSRFPSFTVRAEVMLAFIASKALMFAPTAQINHISDDSDNRILELAVESSADFIITGNTNDFSFSSYGITRILTPKEYWEWHVSQHPII